MRIHSLRDARARISLRARWSAGSKLIAATLATLTFIQKEYADESDVLDPTLSFCFWFQFCNFLSRPWSIGHALSTLLAFGLEFSNVFPTLVTRSLSLTIGNDSAEPASL